MTPFEQALAKVTAEADEKRRVQVRLQCALVAGKLEKFQAATIALATSVTELVSLIEEGN